ncbi:DUF565 domain-containing protein [Leptolyngbya sp. FACHB-261]|uniref:DUF565 domain-containing protein n=1 Tax=Leptolyngbya sp. FACHB-261 TaxID=2692806 RepID=UPI0016873862|nr:DUF565 domain-containing protein [Leptolyngbya sp. FACHB-261]MBD2105119.1 DUF565 domain-containing protein [Leptolyngbya sp. FACHB-261]
MTQDTRLSTLVDALLDYLEGIFRNPWRRLLVLLLSLLLGAFLGHNIPALTGARSFLDEFVALGIVISTELINWIVHANFLGLRNTFLSSALNALKLGLEFALAVEACKLGS